MRTLRSHPVVLALIALMVAGCSSATGPELSPRLAAGTYVLTTVSGRGPASGGFVLGADARAERHVRYESGEYVAVGTFERAPGTITFHLRENGGQSEYVWTVRGEFNGDGFVIRYPDPADGEITERYRRL
jgi:hypothetical protein